MLKLLKIKSKVLSKIVFCGESGGYLNQNKFVKNYFKRAVREMGREDLTFHSLRHTYASYLLSQGIPIKFVQEQFGHSIPQTTLNIYNHVMPNTKEQAMNCFNKIYEQKKSIKKAIKL